MPYTDGNICFGTKFASLPIVRIPEGWELYRARFRNREFATCYLKSATGFARWYLDFTDETKTALYPTTRIAVNIRPRRK